MSDSATAIPLRSDVEVISVVGFAHGTSHFFHLVLPSLFPWLMRDFGLNFTQAGSLTAAFFVVSGIGQALAGFVVDRFGAQRVLWAGITLFSIAAVVLGSANSYGMLVAAALLAGAGNSVFHPADFTVLNRRVSQPRLGHAFSVHGLSGNLGWAAGPVVMTAIAASAGWRAAAFVAASVALSSLALLILARGVFIASNPLNRETASGALPKASPIAFLGVAAVWMCFLFFFLTTMSFGAVQNFGPAVVRQIYGLSLAGGASALTSYLLGGAAGIALGGFLATKSNSHDKVVAATLVFSALTALTVASGAIPSWSVAPFFALIGFFSGIATPSRDLLVRKAAMERFGQQSFGRIYGFVYSGLDVGLAIAPVIFGRLMDKGLFSAVLGSIALLQGFSILTALGVGQHTPKDMQVLKPLPPRID